MNSLVWVFSVVLALVFLIVGLVRVFKYELAKERFPWVNDVPRALVTVIGIAEIMGALGLVLPAATGILPWLTPVAAAGLAILMLMAGTFHGQRREYQEASVNALLLIMTALIAYARWPLLAT
jgi:uncharacterized membrane protein YphA (DoxX/SURF4 family)